MVTSISCSSVRRKKAVEEVEDSPTAALMLTVLVKPALAVARPVVGLKLLAPAPKVMLMLLALSVFASAEITVSMEMIRLSVALMSTSSVSVMLTVWVQVKVS